MPYHYRKNVFHIVPHSTDVGVWVRLSITDYDTSIPNTVYKMQTDIQFNFQNISVLDIIEKVPKPQYNKT